MMGVERKEERRMVGLILVLPFSSPYENPHPSQNLLPTP